MQELELELVDPDALAFLEELDFVDDGLELIDGDNPLAGVLVAEAEAQKMPVADAGSSGRDNASAAITTSDAAQMKTKRKPRAKKVSAVSNRARDQRRLELVHLRSKVADLEAQLEELMNDDDDTKERATGVAAACSTGQRTAPLSVWAEIASRQYTKRQHAELKNIRLKMLLQSQIKVAKGLEKLLNNRTNTQIAQLCGDDIPRVSPTGLPYYQAQESDSDVFQILLADLDQAVLKVNDTYETNGLNRNERPFQDASIINNRRNGIHLEVLGNKLMPFGIHATSNAIWKHQLNYMERMPYRFYFERQRKTMEETDDTLMESFHTELHSKHGVGYVHIRKVMRRYVEEDRIIIAWREAIDPIEYSSKPIPAIRFIEQGYFVIKRPTVAPPDYSLIQACFHMRPDERNYNHPHFASMIGQLSSFFLDTLARSMYFTNQMVEDSLLEQSIHPEAQPMMNA